MCRGTCQVEMGSNPHNVLVATQQEVLEAFPSGNCQEDSVTPTNQRKDVAEDFGFMRSLTWKSIHMLS